MFSQATSLTIDCQNPGWLSNMIPYGDQQTLENLTVTGYINQDDLLFIGKLIHERSLHGRLNLDLVNIVGNTSAQDNILPSKMFETESPDSLSCLILPLSATEYDRSCLVGLKIDTLIAGGPNVTDLKNSCYGINYSGTNFNVRVKNLIIREGTTKIGGSAFDNGSSYSAKENECHFSSISFPNSLRSIGARAFCNNYKLHIGTLPDSIEVIELRAFQGIAETPDTLRLPKRLKKYHTTAFLTKKEKHPSLFYFDENIDTIDNVYETYNQSFNKYYKHDQITSSSIVTMHVAAKNPPKFIYSSGECLSKSIIYVPKQSISLYSNTLPWKNATILAEPTPLKALTLNHHELLMGTNETYQLSCSFIPSDASNKYVTWVSSNNDVATVSYGDVSAKAIGEAYIYVISNENPEIKDSCLVTVVVPVEGITISQNECTLAVGSNLKLETAVNPANATNKKVLWNSSNESVCTVKDGLITAIAKGTSIITATTEESNFRASCTVTVVQPVTNITLDHSTYELHSIGASGKLTATVEPEDASNKDVTWKSSNESVCIVSNGTIIAVGYGEAVIIATSVDGGHMAICTVTVDNKTAVGDIDTRKATYKVFNLQGIEKVQFQKGINIIRFKDGTTKKILIK